MWETKRKIKQSALSFAVLFAMTMSLPVSAAALELIPVGSAVGIEVDVDGAMVEELSEVNTSKGAVQPAKKAGIKEGDVITAVNGKEINSLSDFARCAQAFDGSTVKITVLRQGKTIDCNVTPVLNTEGKYQIGLWLRDKVAGVGTVTYYNPKTGEYGALGHGINDPESGTLIPISDGKTFDASIVDVVHGKVGDPGELTGSFDTHSVFGTVAENSVYGIFGTCKKIPQGQKTVLETTAYGEAKVGPAEILSTVAGAAPRSYTVHIDKVERRNGEERYQLTVTDPALLEKTGGVVCGMGVIDNMDNTKKPVNAGFSAVTLKENQTSVSDQHRHIRTDDPL